MLALIPAAVWKGLGAFALFGLLCWGAVSWHASYRDGLIEQGVNQEKVAQHVRDVAAMAAATKVAYEAERAALAASTIRSEDRLKEVNSYEERIKVLQRRVAAGDVGMRIPTKPTAGVCGAAAPGAAPAVGGSQPAASADLLPETVNAILDIAAGDRRNVQSYNSLLAEYRDLETRCSH